MKRFSPVSILYIEENLDVFPVFKNLLSDPYMLLNHIFTSILFDMGFGDVKQFLIIFDTPSPHRHAF